MVLVQSRRIMRAPGTSRSLPVKPARGIRGGRQAMFARAPLSWGQLLGVLLVGVLILYLLIAALSPG